MFGEEELHEQKSELGKYPLNLPTLIAIATIRAMASPLVKHLTIEARGPGLLENSGCPTSARGCVCYD